MVSFNQRCKLVNCICSRHTRPWYRDNKSMTTFQTSFISSTWLFTWSLIYMTGLEGPLNLPTRKAALRSIHRRKVVYSYSHVCLLRWKRTLRGDAGLISIKPRQLRRDTFFPRHLCVADSACIQHAERNLLPSSPQKVFLSNLFRPLTRRNDEEWQQNHETWHNQTIGEYRDSLDNVDR